MPDLPVYAWIGLGITLIVVTMVVVIMADTFRRSGDGD